MVVTRDIKIDRLNHCMEMQAAWHLRLVWWRDRGGSESTLIAGVCMDECRKSFINAKYWRESLENHYD